MTWVGCNPLITNHVFIQWVDHPPSSAEDIVTSAGGVRSNSAIVFEGCGNSSN